MPEMSSGGGGASFGSSGALTRGIGAFGAAVSDLYASEGLKISAAGYREAASITGKNIDLTKESQRIKSLQAEREIYKALGGQESAVASSGLAASGSALDVMRDSAAQGVLTMDLLKKQGEIDLNTLKLQQVGYETQANAADNAAEGKLWSAGINAVAGVVSIGSFFA